MQPCQPFSGGPRGNFFGDLFQFLDCVIPNLDSPHHPQASFLCSGGRLFCVEAPPSTRLGLLLSKEVELWPEELWEIMEALCFQLLSSSILGYSASAVV